MYQEQYYQKENADQLFQKTLESKTETIKNRGSWQEEIIITSPQQTYVIVQGRQNKMLNFCSNNYLGLSNNEDIILAAINSLKNYGAGLSASRYVCGTQNIHKELEEKISKFHGKEDTILYGSGFDANVGLFEAILGPEDAIFSDILNHASIIDGIRLCKAKKFVYPHRDMKALQKLLEENQCARLKLIVTDGVFSMDATFAPLPEIITLAKKYNALTFVDESHATGILGHMGRGIEEYFNMEGSVDIINSSLAKALGGVSGGYTTGPKKLIELLRQTSRSYVFSSSPCPAVVAAGIKVMDLLTKSNSLSVQVKINSKRFRDTMTKAGFIVSGENHPICPVMVGDAKLAKIFAEKLFAKGIYAVSLSYPIVPKDKARIRVVISAAHTEEEMDEVCKYFISIGKKLGVIPSSNL